MSLLPAINWNDMVSRRLLAMALLALAYMGSGMAQAKPWHVVVLVGADVTQPAAAQQLQVLRAALKEQAPEGAEIFIDPLDTLRFETASLEAPFMDLIERKYAGRHVDLVIGLADFSIDFVSRYGGKIWPGAPVLISSVPLSRMNARPLPGEFTYLPFKIDIEGTLRLVNVLQPSLRRLVVVVGSTGLDQFWLQRIRNFIKTEPRPKWGIEIWDGLSEQEILQRSARLENDTAILLTTMYRDKSGNSYIPADVASVLTSVSPVPVYGWYRTYEGLASGMLVDFNKIGRETAKVAAEILTKARPTGGVLPPVGSDCVADVGRLASFGVGVSALPPDCQTFNHPPSLWRDHRQLVLIVSATLVLQACTIFGLLWQRRRRRLAEHSVAQRTNELTRATRVASVGEMGAAITHEISQPLGAIVSNADAASLLLTDAPEGFGEIRHIVEDIQRDALRASQILTRQRALMHKLEFTLAPVVADEALEDGIALLAPEARRRECRLHVDLRCKQTYVMADRIQLQQIMLNLAINALDAMQDRPAEQCELAIATHLDEGDWVMTVADTGNGIDPEALPHIFESFYTTKDGGTGLGLSIVRTIVSSHGGKIGVTSEFNKGTTFKVRLPLLATPS